MNHAEYDKKLPGAELIFRPDELDAYTDEAWDIRISLDEAPLEDAFFCSVASLAEADRPIADLLDSVALNPAQEANLDLEHYPELPFLQQELIQIMTGVRQGHRQMKVFVNGHPGEIDLQMPASDLLCLCRYLDHSWDYLVLDLIWKTSPTEPQPEARQAFCERHADISQEAIPSLAAELQHYDQYESVAIAPCALGVPDGFDVQLQMMEFDGLDPERGALIQALHSGYDTIEDAFPTVYARLSKRTFFTREVLENLKACGQTFENA